MSERIEEVDSAAVPIEAVTAVTHVDVSAPTRTRRRRVSLLLALGLAVAWAVVYLVGAALYPAASLEGGSGAGILFASRTKTLLAVGSALLIMAIGLAMLVAALAAAWRRRRAEQGGRAPLALAAVGLVMLLLPTFTVATSYALDTRGIVDRVASGPGVLPGSDSGFG